MVGRNLSEARAAATRDLLTPSRHDLDLLDGSAVADYVARYRPAVIIHAAGRVGGIQANMANPTAFLADNLRMGLNVLEAGAGMPDCRVINLSSSCVYPPSAPNPLREDAVLTAAPEPTNEGYALAKIAVMRFAAYCNRELGEVRLKTLIPCNLFGRYDSFDPVRSHLVPAIVAKLETGRAEQAAAVEIWGDGSARREFALASDVAGWIWQAVDAFDALPEAMNLGIGEDHSVLDYYRATADVIGWTGTFTFDRSRPVGMARKLVDNTRQQALGFAPPTALAAGLDETIRYYRTELPR